VTRRPALTTHCRPASLVGRRSRPETGVGYLAPRSSRHAGKHSDGRLRPLDARVGHALAHARGLNLARSPEPPPAFTAAAARHASNGFAPRDTRPPSRSSREMNTRRPLDQRTSDQDTDQGPGTKDCGVNPAGAKMSVAVLRKSNPGGMTPMMSVSTPSSRTVLPTISGSPAKRRCQKS
jgi:hypothetical protein